MGKTIAFLLFLLASCGTATPATTPAVLRVEYTFSAQPWLAQIYDCAGGNTIVAEQRSADFIGSQFDIDMAIRIGEPLILASPAYQISTEDILVVLNRTTSITRLTAEQVRDLFNGRITNWNQIARTEDGKVQVWIFPVDEDIQQVFQQAALAGTTVTSLARLAADPDEMSQAVAADPNAVGILPRRWKAGNLTEAYVAASVPVLAITPNESTQAVQVLLACLQK